MRRPAVGALLVAAVMLGGAAIVRADTLLLQQSLPGGVAGTSFLLVDRGRIGHVTARRDETLAHKVTIWLATEPPVELSLACNDEAITRQLMEALRQGGVATLDITGRCSL